MDTTLNQRKKCPPQEAPAARRPPGSRYIAIYSYMCLLMRSVRSREVHAAGCSFKIWFIINLSEAIVSSQQSRLTIDTLLQAPVRACQHPAAKTLIVDTFDLSHTAAPLGPPPEMAASVEEKIEFLHQQLNSIGPESAVISGLVLLGSSQHQRLQGGALPECI
jgi:hypothetical protein